MEMIEPLTLKQARNIRRGWINSGISASFRWITQFVHKMKSLELESSRSME